MKIHCSWILVSEKLNWKEILLINFQKIKQKTTIQQPTLLVSGFIWFYTATETWIILNSWDLCDCCKYMEKTRLFFPFSFNDNAFIGALLVVIIFNFNKHVNQTGELDSSKPSVIAMLLCWTPISHTCVISIWNSASWLKTSVTLFFQNKS